jgi:capsular polysaccharide transport system ATP-binding protein
LIDEVLAVGDPTFRQKASRVFKEKLERAGVILVSHNQKEIKDLCSSVILVHNGQAMAYDDVDEGFAAFNEMMEESKS